MSEYTIRIDIITPDGRRLAGQVVVPEDEAVLSELSAIDVSAMNLLDDILEALYEDENKIDE